MMSKMNKQVAFVVAVTLSMTAAVSNAQITNVSAVAVPNSIVGFVTTDILIDFAGQYSGSQLLIEGLPSGSFYQDGFGTATPPNGLFIPTVPSLEFDTFVAQGGPDIASTDGNLALGGGAVDLGGDSIAVFSEDAINQAWNPSSGNIITDQTGFLVARITISDAASGSAFFLASSAGQVLSPLQGTITNGALSFGSQIPEPTTLALAGLGLIGAFATRRRRS